MLGTLALQIGLLISFVIKVLDGKTIDMKPLSSIPGECGDPQFKGWYQTLLKKLSDHTKYIFLKIENFKKDKLVKHTL
jgi:hypothetical protein